MKILKNEPIDIIKQRERTCNIFPHGEGVPTGGIDGFPSDNSHVSPTYIK